MFEGSTKQSLLETVATVLFGYVSGLIKLCFSLVGRLALTKLGQSMQIGI